MTGPGCAGLIAALDTADLAQAKKWVAAVCPPCAMIKLGLEFFATNGPDGVAALSGTPLFLDLKLHDIPTTVAGAVRGILPLGAAMLTVHAAGGAAMIAAARAAAEAAGEARPRLLTVTVLTSLDAAALAATGIAGGPRQQVLRLARLALDAGADGLVCAPNEVALLREAFGGAPLLVVPGIRPRNAPVDDQARTMTAGEAAAAGADWLVVGRPITRAPDPHAAALALAAEIGPTAQAAPARPA